MALTPNHAKPVEHLNPHLQKVQHLNALPLLSHCTTFKKVLDNRESRKNRRQTVRRLKKDSPLPIRSSLTKSRRLTHGFNRPASSRPTPPASIPSLRYLYGRCLESSKTFRFINNREPNGEKMHTLTVNNRPCSGTSCCQRKMTKYKCSR